jgi:hypothetical protein
MIIKIKLQTSSIVAQIFGLVFCCGFGFSQKVGIGTATPAEKLHVAGGARVNSLAGAGTRVVSSELNGTLNNIAAGTNGQVFM